MTLHFLIGLISLVVFAWLSWDEQSQRRGYALRRDEQLEKEIIRRLDERERR